MALRLFRRLPANPVASRFLALRQLSESTGSAAPPELLVDYRDDGITVVSLNRVAGKNSLSKSMLNEFNEVVEELREDTTVKVVIIKSTVAKVFCAGADLKERKSMKDEEVADFVSKLRDSFTAFSTLPMPTIAAIEGAALGGGLELALACDIRIAGKDSIIGLPETALAIIPGAGGTQRLPRLIGSSKAKELIFTARKLNGHEAKDFGIVNECVEAGSAEKRALEIAASICASGPIAIRMAKAAIDGGSNVDLETGLQIEKACYGQVIYTLDRKEGLLAFAEKRTPQYKGM